MLSIPERMAIASTYRQMPDAVRSDTLYTCVISELSARCKAKGINPEDKLKIRMEAASLSNEVGNWLRDFTD